MQSQGKKPDISEGTKKSGMLQSFLQGVKNHAILITGVVVVVVLVAVSTYFLISGSLSGNPNPDNGNNNNATPTHTATITSTGTSTRTSTLTSTGTGTTTSTSTATTGTGTGTGTGTIPLPAQVSGVTAKASSPTSIAVNWSSATGAASYVVKYTLSTDTSYSNATTVTVSSGTTSTISSLTADTSYRFVVYGVNSSGNGTSSVDTVTCQTPVTALWKLSFSSGAPVNVGSATTVVPTVNDAGGCKQTFVQDVATGSDSTVRGLVLSKISSGTTPTNNITLSNSSLPSNYTKTCWFKTSQIITSSTVTYSSMIGSVSPSTGVHGFLIAAGNPCAFHGTVNVTSNTTNSVYSPTTIAINIWYFAAVTFDGNNLKLYVSDFSGGAATAPTLKATSSLGSSYSSGDVCEVGHYDPTNAQAQYNSFFGKLDFPSMYGTALTLAQINALYLSEFR